MIKLLLVFTSIFFIRICLKYYKYLTYRNKYLDYRYLCITDKYLCVNGNVFNIEDKHLYIDSENKYLYIDEDKKHINIKENNIYFINSFSVLNI